MKNPLWRQSNPRDQLIVVLMAAQGIVDNIQDNVYKPGPGPKHIETKLAEIADLLVQAQTLTKMVNGEWE